MQAFRPLGDLDAVGPVITEGREPVGGDEIALGSITMDKLDVQIGDTVDIRSTVTGTAPTTMTVVGTTVVNDTFETSPGRGGVVAVEWLDANVPEASADPYVVRLKPDADIDAFKMTVEERLSAVVSPPRRRARSATSNESPRSRSCWPPSSRYSLSPRWPTPSWCRSDAPTPSSRSGKASASPVSRFAPPLPVMPPPSPLLPQS